MEVLRTRFWDLKRAIAEAEALLEPLTAARDAFASEAREKEAAMMEPVRAIQADVLDGKSMFDAKQELAAIARALEGKTGAEAEA